MDRSQKKPISDELLSAYIDGVVTSEERARVEAAVAADPVLAWELESLRRTVDLVRDLPPVPLPRSFALREEQVADVLAERQTRNRQAHGSGSAPAPLSRPIDRPIDRPIVSPGFWQQILSFFNSGNLVLRNAAAVAALLLVVITLSAPQTGAPLASPTDGEAGASVQAESSAPVAQRAAPQTEAAEIQPAEAQPAEVQPVEVQPAEAAVEAAPAAEQASAAAETEAGAATAAEAPASKAGPAAEAAEAPVALVEPAVADAPPRPAGDAPAAMSAASESITGPVARMPAAGTGGENPQAFQAVPADLGPVGDGVIAPARAGEIPEEAAQTSTVATPTPAPTTGPAPTATAAPDTFASAPQDAPPEQAETPLESRQDLSSPQGGEDQPAVTPSAWPGWRAIQMALAGLALLLGGLWFFTTRA